MPFILANRVKDTTTTTGTGTVTLSGTAPLGYQTFGAGIGNGNSTYYTITAGSEWEVGIGTYSSTGPTLSRDTVLSSSAGGTTKVTFSAGTKDVFVTLPSERIGAFYPQNVQSGNYTLALSDAGDHIYSANTGAQTITIPTNASVAFGIGTTITIVNMGTTQILLSALGVSLYANGSATALPGATVAPGNTVQLLKTGTNAWQATFGNLSAAQFSYLIVAGGGGGGQPAGGGGGGAGGLLTGTSSIASGTLTVSVGGGGTGGTWGGAASTNGTNSSITGLTAAVGGGAGNPTAGASGGSGGGGGGNGSSYSGGSGTSGQGNAGGGGGAFAGGGGGGAGAVGASTTGSGGGNGGAGLASSITGSSVTYAGGGGGGTAFAGSAGTGGAGGGGTGGFDNGNGTAGTANTGGGGGGGPNNNPGAYSGGSGGSGVVIIRSPIPATSTTGSPTITTVGSDTVYRFTSSGTITW